jgi:glycine hydroxymethyltransferase
MAHVDELEALVEQRALKAFGLDPDEWHVNVQPYSGSPANAAIFMALLEPQDKIMAMYLSDGGHISHGWMFKEKRLSFASKYHEIVFYHVNKDTYVFDYAEVQKEIAAQKPNMVISGGTAYPRDIDHAAMGKAAKDAGAYYLADVSHEAGLIAAGVLNSPFDHADVVMCTTHKTLRGPRGALIFARKEIMPKIDKAVFPGLQGGPHNHTIAGIGVALKETMNAKFKAYSRQVVTNAQTLAQELEKHRYDIVSGGTDKHLVLIDLRKQGLTGKIPAIALEYANLVMNFNTVPYDTGSPLYPSGLRLGTPAITTRGMKEKEMKQIAQWIHEVISEVSHYRLPENPKERRAFVEKTTKELESNKTLKRIAEGVVALTDKFPLKY